MASDNTRPPELIKPAHPWCFASTARDLPTTPVAVGPVSNISCAQHDVTNDNNDTIWQIRARRRVNLDEKQIKIAERIWQDMILLLGKNVEERKEE